MKKSTNDVHPVDVHVGRRLKARREKIGISQNELASAVSLTFQQIQKYEKGTNRVSSSKLYDFARILSVDVEFFFRGLEEYYTSPSFANQNSYETMQFMAEKLSDFQSEKEEEESKLLSSFRSIECPKIKKKVVELVYSIAL